MKKNFILFIMILSILSCKMEIKPSIGEDALDESIFAPLELNEITTSSKRMPTIGFSFNKKIDFASLKVSQIEVKENISNQVIQFDTEASPDGKSILLKMKEALNENKNYIVTFNKIKDIYGLTLSVNTNFWTGFFTPVEINFPDAFSEFFIDKNAFVQFSSDVEIDSATVNISNIWVQKKGDSSQKLNLINFNYDNIEKRLEFTIESLAEGELYELVISDGVKYSDGNKTPPLTVVFTGRNYSLIKSSSPIAGEIVSSDFSSFNVTFKDGISFNELSIKDSNIFIREKEGAILNSNNFSYNSATKTCSFGLATSLITNKNYEFIIENILFDNGAKSLDLVINFPCLDFTTGANFLNFAMTQPTFGDDPNDSNYVIVFQDDFNTKFTNEIQTHDAAGSKFTHSSSPDPSKWDVITDFKDNGWYKAENAFIDEDKGRLVIRAEQKSGTLNNKPASESEAYTRVAGRIQSKQKFGFLYGKVYAKFKLAKEASWPALWFITNAEKYLDEIDMLEYYPHRNSRDWQAVFHAGTDWGSGKWAGGNNILTLIGDSGTNLYDFDIESVMNWDSDLDNNSSIKINSSLFTPYTSSKIGDYEVCPLKQMEKRYLRPVYPILEIQLRGYGVAEADWDTHDPDEPKEFEIDYIKIAQKKSKRYATVIDEFFTLDNTARTLGIRKATFSYPTVEGINYGNFRYFGQPLYEKDLVIVDESLKDVQQEMIYKVKNVRGISLLVYYDPDIGMPRKSSFVLDKTTGFPDKAINEYASDPSLNFMIQAAPSSGGPWTDIPFDARWDGNDKYLGNSGWVAKNFEKIVLPEKTYNYIKIKFPLVGTNWNKILLSKVVFTRYEGTDYNEYKIEGE